VDYEATGPFSTTYGPDVYGAIEAAFKQQNAAGGVNGRQIEITGADDQSTAVGNLNAAKLLVAKPVFTMINQSILGTGTFPYLLQEGIPTVAYGSGATGQPTYTNAFTPLPSGNVTKGIPQVSTLGDFFKSIGVTRVAMIYPSDPQSSQGFHAQQSAFQASGITVCYANNSLPPGTVDFTTVALAIKQNNCQGSWMIGPTTGTVAFLKAIDNAGIPNFKPLVTGVDETWLTNSGTLAAANGAYFEAVGIPVQNPLSNNSSAIQAYLSALTKYDSSYHGGLPNLGANAGWLDAQLMIQGLKLAGANPTRASFEQGLTGLTSFDAGGVITPVTSVQGWVNPNLCTYFLHLNGTTLSAVPASGNAICGTVISG
jgi:branched-chain amino acid transport system substrate-binding protein